MEKACRAKAIEDCDKRKKTEGKATKDAVQRTKKIEALKPPAEWAKQLDAMPTGLRLGIALMGHFGGTMESDPWSIEFRPVFMPYLSYDGGRGNVTEAYCAAERYGARYAQAVADDYAVRLRENGPDSGWNEGYSGSCNRPLLGGYFGIAFPYRTNLRRNGHSSVVSDVRFITAFGGIVQFGIVGFLLGPTFSLVERPRDTSGTVLEGAWGVMFGVGTSFSIGSSVLK